MEKSVIRNLNVILSASKGAYSVWTITGHTRGWAVYEWNLKIMNLTYLHPKKRGNLENKNETSVNIRLAAKKYRKSEIFLKTSDLILKHQKW